LMPESRVWYRLQWVISNVGNESSPLLPASRGDIRGGWSGLFSTYHRRALLVGVVLGVVQALCGINAVLIYAQRIFIKTGFETNKELMTLILGGWNCASTLLAVFIVDKAGRKPLLMVGLTCMSVGLGVLAASEQFLHALVSDWISFTALFLFVFGFAIGPGATFWVLVADVFDESVRGQGSSLINLQQWTENLVLVSVFPLLDSVLPNAVLFWFFCGIVLVAQVLLAFYLKEKKRLLLLNDIDD